MISDTVKAIMTEKGVTQTMLAGRMGVSVQSLSNKLCRDTLTARDLVSILEAMDCQLVVEPVPGFAVRITPQKGFHNAGKGCRK